MKKAIILSAMVLTVLAVSGCSTKSPCAAKKLPTCASGCVKVPVPCPCGK